MLHQDGNKRTLGLAAAILVLILTVFLAPPGGMTIAGKNTLGVLLAALLLWTTEAVPIAVTAMAILILQPIYGIADINTAFSEFISSVIFFVIASYGISVSIMKTSLASRMAVWMLSKAGNSSAKVIVAFTVSTALISTIVSNVPATLLFMGLALSILDEMKAKPGTSRLGRALMISIPFGAMIGGIATPAGSSVNILVLHLLERYAGVTISFLEWMAYGVPIMVVMLPVCAFCVVKIFRPEPIDIDMEPFLQKTGIDQPLTVMEKKVLIVLALMMAFWIASTWVTAINITVVAVIGMIVLFLPGMDVLTWEEFVNEVGWDAILTIGGVTSIGAAIVSTGLSSWFLDVALAGIAGWGLVPLTGFLGMLVNIIHLVLPIGPAIVAVFMQPLSDLAASSGVSPTVFAITLAFLSGCCLLLPIDAVPLITYNKKYYSMFDMFKAGAVVSTVWVVLTALWVPLLNGIML